MINNKMKCEFCDQLAVKKLVHRSEVKADTLHSVCEEHYKQKQKDWTYTGDKATGGYITEAQAKPNPQADKIIKSFARNMKITLKG